MAVVVGLSLQDVLGGLGLRTWLVGGVDVVGGRIGFLGLEGLEGGEGKLLRLEGLEGGEQGLRPVGRLG